MEEHNLCRISSPKESNSSEIGILYLDDGGYVEGTTLVNLPRKFFVDVLDMKTDGLEIKTQQTISPDTIADLKIYNKTRKTWDILYGRTKFVKPDPEHKNHHLVEIEVIRKKEAIISIGEPPRAIKKTPHTVDYEFFRKTELFRSIPKEAICPFLNCITFRRVRVGQRFIVQGEPGDSAYLIQSGNCVVNVEKDGKLTPVARLSEGALVGEMAILTGEPRNAHVDAESDMDLWCITREQFKDLSQEFPDLRYFITELLTLRFDKTTVTAERRIGKYILKDIIGKGGFSIVYRGMHEGLNMPVAIKMMKHDMAMEADFINNFRNEAKTVASFNHDNIIKVYDIEERYQTMFVIMEHLEGMSLRTLLNKSNKLHPKQIVNYLIQICAGLQYAHKFGIVHQDIKPGNIYVLPSEKVKILDFGLACPCGSENFLTGTPFYMSPEQIDCMPVDERADIYALGITAFEMATGMRPFPEQDAMAVMDMHVNNDIPDPVELEPELPEALRNFIIKACSRDLSARYRDVAEIVKELRPLVDEFAINNELEFSKKQKGCISLLNDPDNLFYQQKI